LPATPKQPTTWLCYNFVAKEDFYGIQEEIHAGGSGQVFKAIELATKVPVGLGSDGFGMRSPGLNGWVCWIWRLFCFFSRIFVMRFLLALDVSLEVETHLLLEEVISKVARNEQRISE